MIIAANTMVILVALLHIYFLVLEMFLWDKPAGLKAFGQPKEKAAATNVLAANQGLYNGLLAAALLVGVLNTSISTREHHTETSKASSCRSSRKGCLMRSPMKSRMISSLI